MNRALPANEGDDKTLFGVLRRWLNPRNWRNKWKKRNGAKIKRQSNVAMNSRARGSSQGEYELDGAERGTSQGQFEMSGEERERGELDGRAIANN